MNGYSPANLHFDIRVVIALQILLDQQPLSHNVW
jgi:hypothetical protein